MGALTRAFTKAGFLFAVILIFALTLTVGSGNAEAASIGDKVTVNVGYLNVRAGAGTNYPIIDGFVKGEITEVGGYYDNWLIVKTHNPNRYGYVYSQYLKAFNAVAPGYNSEDLYWLARIVSAEAKGELFNGQIAVANVVINRVASGNFPNTVKGVIFERYYGFAQFSPVDDGSIYDEPTAQAVEAAKQALNGYNIVPGALYFYNPYLTSWDNWVRTRPVITQIGNHVFAR